MLHGVLADEEPKVGVGVVELQPWWGWSECSHEWGLACLCGGACGSGGRRWLWVQVVKLGGRGVAGAVL